MAVLLARCGGNARVSAPARRATQAQALRLHTVSHVSCE
jgi:hypothetical protein